jgi:hypothetical protein
MSALSLRSSVAALAVAAVFLLAACGGSPAGPSAPGPAARGVTVLGTVVGTSASSSGVSAFDTSTTALVVSVRENPAVAVPVAADGTFTLRGLPDGQFTLVFLRAGAEVGTLTFTGLAPNQELSLTVAVETSGVVLLEERRNGIGHGDVEVQGRVEAVIVLDPAGESRFTIAGRSVVVRPGETAIREGNRARTVAEVTLGRQVHVKGVWLPAGASGQSLLAHEIKLQGDLEDDEDDEGDPECAISGGRAGERIELQGTVRSGGAAAFVLDVQGNRSRVPVPVDAASASFECSPASGPNAPTLEQCKARVTAGARVHVRGTLTSCSATAAAARASVVRVQN